MIDYEHDISAIDAALLRHGMASIHLLRAGDEAALVDCGTGHSLPNVLAALAHKGIAADKLRYVILTHVHLDHASGAGAAMRAFPNAQLVVHPRGARHMIDPSKLITGATDVYGAQAMADMYGDILPVDAARVIETHDGYVLDFNGRTLEFIDTPGHAKHHHCIWDARSQGWFTGDTFGLAYPECTVDGRAFILPDHVAGSVRSGRDARVGRAFAVAAAGGDVPDPLRQGDRRTDAGPRAAVAHRRPRGDRQGGRQCR